MTSLSNQIYNMSHLSPPSDKNEMTPYGSIHNNCHCHAPLNSIWDDDKIENYKNEWETNEMFVVQ